MIISRRLGGLGFNAPLSKEWGALIEQQLGSFIAEQFSIRWCWRAVSGAPWGLWERPWILHLLSNPSVGCGKLALGLRQRNRNSPVKTAPYTKGPIPGRQRKDCHRTRHACCAPTSEPGRVCSTEFFLTVPQTAFHSCFCGTCHTRS